MTRGKVNAFELRGFENPLSASQSEKKAFVFELSNDLLIGQSAVRLSNRKHSLSFEPHYFWGSTELASTVLLPMSRNPACVTVMT